MHSGSTGGRQRGVSSIKSMILVYINYEPPVINMNKCKHINELQRNLSLIIVIIIRLRNFFGANPLYKEVFLNIFKYFKTK